MIEIGDYIHCINGTNEFTKGKYYIVQMISDDVFDDWMEFAVIDDDDMLHWLDTHDYTKEFEDYKITKRRIKLENILEDE